MKPYKIRIGIALVGAFFTVLCATLVLRNLGMIVGLLLGSGGDIDFARIFTQIKDASITPHVILPLLCFGGFSMLYAKRQPQSVGRIVGCAFVGVLCFFVAFVSALLLTRVNGIRFIHLLKALIPMLGAL